MSSEPVFKWGYTEDGHYFVNTNGGDTLLYYAQLAQTTDRDTMLETAVSSLNEMMGELDE